MEAQRGRWLIRERDRVQEGECGWVREGSKKEGAFKTGPEGMERFLSHQRRGGYVFKAEIENHAT